MSSSRRDWSLFRASKIAAAPGLFRRFAARQLVGAADFCSSRAWVRSILMDGDLRFAGGDPVSGGFPGSGRYSSLLRLRQSRRASSIWIGSCRACSLTCSVSASTASMAAPVLAALAMRASSGLPSSSRRASADGSCGCESQRLESPAPAFSSGVGRGICSAFSACIFQRPDPLLQFLRGCRAGGSGFPPPGLQSALRLCLGGSGIWRCRRPPRRSPAAPRILEATIVRDPPLADHRVPVPAEAGVHEQHLATDP